MNQTRLFARKRRNFLPSNLEVKTWIDISEYADELLEFPVRTSSAFLKWLNHRSEFDSVLQEAKAWLYINQSCNTDKIEYSASFNRFISQVEKPYLLLTDKLNAKLVQFFDYNPLPPGFDVYLRRVRQEQNIFRELNVPIQSELETEETRYSGITGSMIIVHEGEELTLQQAEEQLRSPDRNQRKHVFELIWKRRLADATNLDNLFDTLIRKRHQLAINAGFDNYIPYRFAQLGRFDYTPADCEVYHDAVSSVVIPVLDELYARKEKSLQIDRLKPYDMEADAESLPPLKAFESSDDLIRKTIRCFNEIDSEFGGYIEIMHRNGFLDLESRKGKAPGGYNYPLYESKVPFIFMNATTGIRDLETMMHEGGHAIHSFLCNYLPYVWLREVPAEMAELASMSMELISMEHWHHFFKNANDLRRAKRLQLEGILCVFPWIAAIDQFQHWIYKYPFHTNTERQNAWCRIFSVLSGTRPDWSEYPEFFNYLWQKQIHLFQYPFYYIEYAIAQLGAIAFWKKYCEDPGRTIANFKNGLAKGYTQTLPELYKTCGIHLDFSKEYLSELIGFLKIELDKLIA
jgi:oligoendopeptidase F